MHKWELGKQGEKRHKDKRVTRFTLLHLLNFVFDYIFVFSHPLSFLLISHERLKGKGTVLVPGDGCIWPFTAASYASSNKSAEDLV